MDAGRPIVMEGAPQETRTSSASSTHLQAEVSDDIVDMENTVGSFIRAAGTPNERELYSMLKTGGHRYTREQIRRWKLH